MEEFDESEAKRVWYKIVDDYFKEHPEEYEKEYQESLKRSEEEKDNAL